MWGQLRTFGAFRLSLIGLALVIWAGLAVSGLVASHSGQVSTGTPQQQQSAEQMIMSLQPPAEAGRDPYDSACVMPDSYCITSTTLEPKTLMAGVISSLKAKGAKLTSKGCAKNSNVALVGRCLASLSYRGALLGLATDTRSGDPLATASAPASRTTPTWLYVVVARDSFSTPHSVALGTWTAEDPLPVAWHVTAVCTTRSAHGCGWYGSKRVPIAVGIDKAATAVRSEMERLGYAAMTNRCFAATASLPRRCMVQGSRFRRLNGGDGELAVVSLRFVDTSHVSVLTQVSAT